MTSPDKTTAITTDLAERAMGARRPQYFFAGPITRAAFTLCRSFRAPDSGLSALSPQLTAFRLQPITP